MVPRDRLAQEALDPATPPERLAALLADELFIAWALARPAGAGLALLARLLERCLGWMWRLPPGDPRQPRATLGYLARHGDENLRAQIAGAPDAEEALGVLMTVAGERVRLSIAWRRDLPASILDRCAADPSPRVRARVARNERAGSPLLARLARDADPEVRATAASHPAAPVDALVRLAQDELPEVRRAAFTHLPVADPAAVEALAAGAGDPDPLVRETIAAHPATPLAARIRLAADRVRRVRCALARCQAVEPRVVESLASDADPLVRLLVVKLADVPGPVLAALASDASADVREAVAGHARTSPPTLRRLAADPSPRVREAVAMRPSLSPDLVSTLRERDDPVVAARLAERPDLDPRTTS